SRSRFPLRVRASERRPARRRLRPRQLTYLLDTNVISELRRIDRAHPDVARWAADVPAHDFLLSVLTLLELERGIVQAERRGRPEAPILRSWYERDVVETFRGRTFPVTYIIARRASQLEG